MGSRGKRPEATIKANGFFGLQICADAAPASAASAALIAFDKRVDLMLESCAGIRPQINAEGRTQIKTQRHEVKIC